MNQCNKKYLLHSLLFGVLAFSVYILSSKGMFADGHVTRNAFAQLAFIPFAFLVQVVTGRSVFSKRYLPEYLIWAIWTIALPVAMYMEYNIAQDWIRFKGETLFGHGMLLGLILLRVIAFDWVKNPLGYLLHGLVYVSMWLLPIVQVIHHAIYGEFISTGAIVALQQTDPKESLEWIMTYIKVPVLLLLGMVLLLIGSFPGVYELKIYRKKKSQVQFLRKKSLVIISLIIWSVMVIKLFPMVGVVDQWKEQRILQAEEQRFNDNYEERFAGIQVHPKYNLTKGTYIIVVGESESRDYMKAYNPEYKYNNTPWLSSMAADDNMIIMDKAYACYNLTKIALGTGFTEASQYNDVSFINSMSLLDVAKKRGYKTYWFSNQIGEQFNEVPIHMVARRADTVKISTNEYDDGLLPLLSTIDPNESNLIILHLLGSHVRYECRFPESERVFDEKSNEGDYANSIYFTDRLLRQVFDYAKANLNLQAMLYFSDHGEDYDLGHGPAIKKWSTLRIPMWIYLSPQYREIHREETANLLLHQHAYFTNDMLYNTLCGLLDMPSNHYRSVEDLTSKEYAFTRDTLFAFNRQVPIADDEGQPDFEYLNSGKNYVQLVTEKR